MEPAHQDRQHGRVAAARAAGDLGGRAAGGEDGPHFGLGDTTLRHPLTRAQPASMARRFAFVVGPPVATVAAFQPAAAGAIAAAADFKDERTGAA